MNSINMWLARFHRRRHGVRANPKGWGRAELEVNFTSTLVLT
jgi:hypothetical protein